MVEEWWESVLKGDCVGNTYFKYKSLSKNTRWSGGKEGYVALCAGCEGSLSDNHVVV